MAQAGAVFTEGQMYLRMKDTGNVYPIHEEQEKLVRKDQAEYVVFDGDDSFTVVKQADPEPKKPVSTPARRPAPPAPPAPKAPAVAKVQAPKPAIDLTVPEIK